MASLANMPGRKTKEASLIIFGIAYTVVLALISFSVRMSQYTPLVQFLVVLTILFVPPIAGVLAVVVYRIILAVKIDLNGFRTPELIMIGGLGVMLLAFLISFYDLNTGLRFYGLSVALWLLGIPLSYAYDEGRNLGVKGAIAEMLQRDENKEEQIKV